MSTVEPVRRWGVSLAFGLLSDGFGLGAGYVFFGSVLLAFSVRTWRAQRQPS